MLEKKKKKKGIQTQKVYIELRIKYNMLGKKNPNFLYKYSFFYCLFLREN